MTGPAVLTEIVLVIAVAALTQPVEALAFCGSPNRYAHGYTSAQQWNGLYAQYKTWTPPLHSLSLDFTDSHVYLLRLVNDPCTNPPPQPYPQSVDPWIELGVFTGTLGNTHFGTQPYSTGANGAEYFDAWGSAKDCVQVRPQKGQSTYGTWNSYELVYDSTDQLGNVYWDALINGNRVEQFQNNDLGKYVGTQWLKVAVALSGGETTDQCYYQTPPCTPSSTYNHISTSAQQVQLQSPTIAWSTWNQALMTLASDSTNTCSDSSVSLSYANNWYNYTADGDVTS